MASSSKTKKKKGLLKIGLKVWTEKELLEMNEWLWMELKLKKSEWMAFLQR